MQQALCRGTAGGQHVDSRALDGPISSGAWADMPLVKRRVGARFWHLEVHVAWLEP